MQLLKSISTQAAGYNRSFFFSVGEVFGGLDIAPGANDSSALLQALAAGKILEVVNSLRGPWAFVYWHAASMSLWFGRDVIGTSPATCLLHSFSFHSFQLHARQAHQVQLETCWSNQLSPASSVLC